MKVRPFAVRDSLLCLCYLRDLIERNRIGIGCLPHHKNAQNFNEDNCCRLWMWMITLMFRNKKSSWGSRSFIWRVSVSSTCSPYFLTLMCKEDKQLKPFLLLLIFILALYNWVSLGGGGGESRGLYFSTPPLKIFTFYIFIPFLICVFSGTQKTRGKQPDFASLGSLGRPLCYKSVLCTL